MDCVPDLIGHKVVLKELSPEYFSDVVRWRNDKELNKFLNQPQELTMETETAWYQQRYQQDDTQGLMVFVDKENDVPFATLGWTDMDREKRRCILGRLLLGNPAYRNHAGFLEGFFLLSDYLYQQVDMMHIHVVKDNRKAIRLNKMLGFVENQGEIQYPHELFVNNLHQREYYRTKEMYQKIRKSLYEDLQEALF
ncbi:Protein N-acetyltransferase, RimJ/RimL family [Selenomonas sp. GACV-9]|uniref:GNAT family N-acetyltransferase n=1 Tax=Selenomonas sp. GACV-9 TaxID=3158782 RepID=UPI0008EDD195|nr:Protein N-acetyltransferase, RimJ/RimL family [Selenomonas ruminantium]